MEEDETRLMDHCQIPQCDGFSELDEFGDPELLRCLHTAEEIMAGMMPAEDVKDEGTGAVEMESEAAEMALVEMDPGAENVVDSGPVQQAAESAEKEAEKITLEIEVAEESSGMDEMVTYKTKKADDSDETVVKAAKSVAEYRTEEMVEGDESRQTEAENAILETEKTQGTKEVESTQEVEAPKGTTDVETYEDITEVNIKTIAETYEDITEVNIKTIAETLGKEAAEIWSQESANEEDITEANTKEIAETLGNEAVEIGSQELANEKDITEVNTNEIAETLRNKAAEIGSLELANEKVTEAHPEGLRKELVELDVGTTVVRGIPEEVILNDASELEVAIEISRARRSSGGVKRKRGRVTARVQSRTPSRKKEEEDVCFICFDGGNLVLCDRRGCPKAYHPSCVNRDEAFFRAKGRWNCGWHICSQCQKSAQYMCYTCTYSLCKVCMKDSEFSCVRGNKGLCVTCMRTVMLIEHNVPANKETAVIDFDDKTNWEYLFKDYWLDLKRKASITSEELSGAKNPCKGSDILTRKEESSGELFEANGDQDSSSESTLRNGEAENPTKRKKAKKLSKSLSTEDTPTIMNKSVCSEGNSASENAEWASNELLELVSHMKNGDKSVLSQFDVQELLLEYIKQNHLRDPHKKSQIICDLRLQNLFGKARVGHFEMLKLLELHIFRKDTLHDAQGAVTDVEAFYVDGESNTDAVSKSGSDKRRKARKRIGERELQSNLDDYAAIDVHNINLLYLKRNLVEELLDDMDSFQERAVGSFVRIRISGTGQKQDMYRLVQLIGIGKATESYKIGKRSTDVTLQILNLNKTEFITIDAISNQEFSEEECKRLRQSIKCGFIRRLTVGEIQDKAKALQEVKVKEALEAEVLRLSHLRDRASEHGRKKNLRECVEKLELLNTPEEHARRLQEIPEIHADPNMDPSYGSEDEEEDLEDKKNDQNVRTKDFGFPRRGRDSAYSGKGITFASDGWNSGRKFPSTRWESNRNVLNKGFAWDKRDFANAAGERSTDSRNQERDLRQASIWDTPKIPVSGSNMETGNGDSQSNGVSGPPPSFISEIALSPSTGAAISSEVNEVDKVWHYQDPSGKIQGPFNMAQLRKWSKTGYFPADLRIWKASEKQEDSVLLTDALIGKYKKEPFESDSHKNLLQHGASNVETDKQKNRVWKSNSKDPSKAANGSVNECGNQLPVLATPPVGSTNNERGPRSSFSGQPYQLPLPHGRDGQVGGISGRIDASQNRGTTMNKPSGFQSGSSDQSGENWKVENNSSSLEQGMQAAVMPNTFAPEGWEQSSRNDSSNLNLPTPTPKPSGAVWNGVHGVVNMWSASTTIPSHSQAAFAGLGTNSTTGGAVGQQSSCVTNELKKTDAVWGEQLESMNHSGTVWRLDVSPIHRSTEIVDGQHKAADAPDMLSSLASQSTELRQMCTDVISVAGVNSTSTGAGSASSETCEKLNFVSGDHQLQSVAQNAIPLCGQRLDPSSGAVLRLDDIPSHNPEILLQPTEDVLIKGPVPGGSVSESLPSGNFVTQSSTMIGNWSTSSMPLPGQPSGWGICPTAASGGIQNNLTPGNVWNSGTAIQPAIPVNGVWTNVPGEIPNTGWGMAPGNKNQVWPPGQANPNMGWGIAQQGNPNWIIGAPGNMNMCWGTEAQNPNSVWAGGPQGQPIAAPPQGQSVTAPPQGQSIAAPSQGQSIAALPQGPAIASSELSTGNMTMWGNQQKQPGERFSGHGDHVFQAGNFSHGGLRAWNRPHVGGPPLRGLTRGQKGVCKFHENGHCKKGASCDYLHT